MTLNSICPELFRANVAKTRVIMWQSRTARDRRLSLRRGCTNRNLRTKPDFLTQVKVALAGLCHKGGEI